MYRNLKQYLELLEKLGELTRIRVPVNTDEEIAEITDRMVKNGGKALFFENTGTPFPVVTNMFGSDRRMALALGVKSLDDIPDRIEEFVKTLLAPKAGLPAKLGTLPALGKASQWFPKNVRGRGTCQQVVLTGSGARLSHLPILKCWPHDGGRFITLPLVHTLDPATGVRNVGMYRMQVLDERTTGMHWHPHKTGARHYEAYKALGEKMPVSICLGGDPAYTYSAIAPMPDGMDEYLLAGFLRERPVRLVKCLTNDIRVPEDCDFVIEGYVDPAEEKFMEGPFGDHTGFYSLEDLYPKFHVEAITFRRDAVYPATVVGIPPQEDLYISKATEKIFLAPIRLAMQPEIKDLYMPAPGVAHNLAIVNIDSNYEGQAAKVASSLWGAGQMMFNKYLIITSTEKDIRDPGTVLELLRGTDMTAAVIRGEGVLDILDHATATPGRGGKLALDLTVSLPVADYEWRKSQAKFKAAAGITSWDISMAEDWGIIVLRSDPVKFPDIPKFMEINKIDNARLIVVTDEGVNPLLPEDTLWLAASNSDPARDASLHKGALTIDGRKKLPVSGLNPRRFPNPVTSSEGTSRLVDIRWDEYGLGEYVPSASDRYRELAVTDGPEI